MKTLILNGSPRENGDTAALLAAFRGALQGEVREISAYAGGIAPCVDCRFCWREAGCAIWDGMQEIYHCVEAFDNLVFASPVFFTELSGPLLALTSRFQTYYAARRFRGGPVPMAEKNGVLLLAAGGEAGINRAITTAKLLFKDLRTTPVAQVVATGTDERPAAENPAALAEAEAAAVLLNRLHEDKG